MPVHSVLEVTSTYAMTPGRLWSLVAILLGLVGLVAGARALARSSRRPGGAGRGPALSLAAGLAGTVIGGAVVLAADGGPGTGYGIVGGFLALVVGLVAMLLGGSALRRSRRLA